MLMGNQGRKAPLWLSCLIPFWKRLTPVKIDNLRTNTVWDCPPCLPFQRDRRWQSRPGVRPFISALTVARCPATFPGVWPQLRDTLSTSRSVGRGTGAFIYALSADETSPALAASRHAITVLFSCRFKCPCPPRRQRHFHGNADRAYNTLHFATQSRVPKGASLETPLRGTQSSQCKRRAISLPPIARLLLSHSACRLPNLNVPQYFLIGCQP